MKLSERLVKAIEARGEFDDAIAYLQNEDKGWKNDYVDLDVQQALMEMAPKNLSFNDVMKAVEDICGVDAKEFALWAAFNGAVRVSADPGMTMYMPDEGDRLLPAVSMPRSRLILTAYMIGNGMSSKLGYVTGAEDLPSEVENIVGSHNFKLEPTGDWSVLSGWPLREWLEEDGIAGCSKENIRIPERFFHLGDEDKRTFINRLWALDGTLSDAGHGPFFSYSTESEGLARDLVEMLMLININGFANAVHDLNKDGDVWRVYIHDFSWSTFDRMIWRRDPECMWERKDGTV
jgi:hypothetical protein